MRLTLITLAAAVALSSTVFAEPTAPGNIKLEKTVKWSLPSQVLRVMQQAEENFL